MPLGFILSGGEASDYTAAEPLMALPIRKPKALLADKGYDSDRFRESLLLHGILPIIPPKANRKVPEHSDTAAIVSAIVSSVCSTNSNNHAASQPATTKPLYP